MAFSLPSYRGDVPVLEPQRFYLAATVAEHIAQRVPDQRLLLAVVAMSPKSDVTGIALGVVVEALVDA